MTAIAIQPPAQRLAPKDTAGLATSHRPTTYSYVPTWSRGSRPLLQAMMLCEAGCTKGPTESEGDLIYLYGYGLTCFLYPCFKAAVHLANMGFQSGVLVVTRSVEDHTA